MDAQISSSLKWWVLAVSALLILITGIDTTAVNLILAPLSAGLHIPLASTQWILISYALVLATCMIAGGKLGDIFGPRYILIIGIIGFTLGSIICAVSHSLSPIIVGRIIQGISAALLSPNAMAITYLAFPKEQHGLATGILTSIMGSSLAIGPFFGGFLTTLYSWRLVFLINIPVGLVGLFLVLLFVFFKPSKKTTLKEIDLPGLIILALTLFSIVTLIDITEKIKQDALLFYGLLIASIVFLFLFIIIEKRSKNPLVNVALFHNKFVIFGCIVRFFFGMPIMILAYIIALYLQQVANYSAVNAGLMFLPFTVAMMLISPFIGKWVDEIGHVLPLTLGIVISFIACLGFALSTKNTPVWWFIVMFGLIGTGLGFTRPALIGAIMKVTPSEFLGLMSSTFNMLNSVGCSVGIAISAAILSYFSLQQTSQQALISTMPIAMYLNIGILLLILILVFTGLRTMKGKQ